MLEMFQKTMRLTPKKQTVKMYSFIGRKPKDIALEVVTSIASVCYQSESTNNQSLYNKLEKESLALPSTSFEFVPVSLPARDAQRLFTAAIASTVIPDMAKHGYFTAVGDTYYYITNLRAMLKDKRTSKLTLTEEYIEEQLNRPLPTCMPLFKVEDVTMYTFGQAVRHRGSSFQVMSRRYVKGDKKRLGMFIDTDVEVKTNNLFAHSISQAAEAYNVAIKAGVKAEVARGILPQCTTTEFWWMFTSPESFSNFLDLRLAKTAQVEIRELAKCLDDITSEGV